MKAKEIRRKFLDFFESKKHQIVASAPMVVKDDPTLMFTNAGMNQFKDVFLGNKAALSPRVADTQKCLRVSGKHNDLEEVGIDTYHHTMFEMLGNWSFGDYFKAEAIGWAWELLTEVYKLDKDRLYITVFGGDEHDGLAPDNEAVEIWKKHAAEDRILFFDKKDNFWEMGDTGPCGPCSEIHVDLRSDEERKAEDGGKLVNIDHPQVIEIWNLVFIQYNRIKDGSLHPLPAKHVDTGMGFERLVRALEGKSSNYDTDVFMPLIREIENASGKTYGKDEKTDIAMRVLSDHCRAVAFAIADGEMPSNNKAGYVIKRILRRAVRYGYTFLNFRRPFLYTLTDVLSDQFEDVFPELSQQKDFIKKVIEQEEISFLNTLENGLKRFEQIREQSDSNTVDGRTAFELYDTFGFPLDLTALIARENGMSIDEEGFQLAMQEQKDRSRKAAASDKSDWVYVHDEGLESQFSGYDTLETETRILRYREVKEKKKSFFQIVLENTPFYAESGGQVGDRGFLETLTGEKISVRDTQKENDLFIHITKELPKNPEEVFKACVNASKRELTTNNHSATHLLHSALQQVLGEHVAQKGSLVNEKILRFDFAHFQKMTDEEIRRTESIVNDKIRENIKLKEMRNVPIEEAKALGAKALFGEKYGDFVRVITFDKDFSVELCGGTHVPATGEIGFFKIIGESSVAAGVRRIEALTAQTAEEYISRELDLLQEIKSLLKAKDLKKSVENLLNERSELSRKVEVLQSQSAQNVKNDLLKNAVNKDGITQIIERVELHSADNLKQLAFELKDQTEQLFMVLAADIDGKPQIAVMISDALVKEKSLHAGNIARELAREIKGGGGGQPFFATAGGKDISGLDAVVEKAKEISI